MDSEVFVYETEKAIVRIHSGKRTKEERRIALEKSCIDFHRAIERQNPGYFERKENV